MSIFQKNSKSQNSNRRNGHQNLKKHFYTAFIFLIYAVILCTCQVRDVPNKLNYTVQKAPEWDSLFIRNNGWFGGDGIFCLPLKQEKKTKSNKRCLIWFSDTMFGTIHEGKLKKGYQMVNNSTAFFDKNEFGPTTIEFNVSKDSTGKPISMFPVNLPGAEKGEYYWLGDGLTNEEGEIIIFAYRIIDRPESDAVFKFEVLGGAIIRISDKSTLPFSSQEQITLPFFENRGGFITSFGAGIYEDKELDWVYIYGIRDPGKQVLVARTRLKDILSFDTWRFWMGNTWGEDFHSAGVIADSASNELSISKISNGEYAMIFQVNGIYPEVGLRLGESPIGPFDKIISLWNCQSDFAEPEFFAYNAKAHPDLSDDGELLISYNVNSFDFWNQIEDHPHLYRPRFIKMIFE